MDTPRLDVAVGLEKLSKGDRYYLGLLRQVLHETRATIAQSSATIAWTRDAIALLDGLSTKQKSVDHLEAVASI